MTELMQLEQQRSDAQKLIERRQMALRLSTDPDFKELILKEFMVQEAARYVQASGDPALNAEQRADSLAIAQSTGHLKRYLSVVVQMGVHAEREMGNLEAAIEAARLEDEAA